MVGAAGDLVGRGEWRLLQERTVCEVSYDWQVRSGRLLFRLLAPVMKRLLVSNHNWAMEKGRIGLQGKLDAL